MSNGHDKLLNTTYLQSTGQAYIIVLQRGQLNLPLFGIGAAASH